MKGYIVEWFFSDWDDYAKKTIFITNDKKFAQNYVRKGNRIFKKYRSYYMKLYQSILDCENLKSHSRYTDFRIIHNRKDLVKGEFYITEIDYRP